MIRPGLFRSFALLAAMHCLPVAQLVAAEDPFINVYTTRHYPEDAALYGKFTSLTGIRVRRSEGSEDELFYRLQHAPRIVPADVVFAVDAGTLGRVEMLGLFAPLPPTVLEAAVPDDLRSAAWTAVSVRARAIIYNKESVNPDELQDYLDLARPAWKGRLCSRSGVSPYNLGLTASIVAHHGEEGATQWVRGVVSNLARQPKGGDFDQIRAVAAGDPCEVALANSYYLAALGSSQKAEDLALMSRIGIVWPNQSSTGVHRNVAGAGLLKSAPHREAAIRFLEFLVSAEAQRHFVQVGREWPAVSGVPAENAARDALGAFRPDRLSMSELAAQDEAARRILNQDGYR